MRKVEVEARRQNSQVDFYVLLNAKTLDLHVFEGQDSHESTHQTLS